MNEEHRSADQTFLFDDEVGDRAFEKAFLLTAQALRRRAGALGAHAVIAIKHDVDLAARIARVCISKCRGWRSGSGGRPTGIPQIIDHGAS